MKSVLQIAMAVGLLCGVGMAQQSGTINTLSVNPRQNLELTNSTGTETGQPSDAVPGSENQPNGLVPVTSNMNGSGSNGNMNQAEAGAKSGPTNGASAAVERKPAGKNSPSSTTAHK